MAYRGDDAGDALEAPTAEGVLKVVLGPNRVDLEVAQRSLHIADRIATMIERKKQKPERRGSVKIAGNLLVARGFPREDVGLWIERVVEPKRSRRAEASGDALPGMQRIFGVEPINPLERDGLVALGRLEALFQRLRAHLADLAGGAIRAIEIGSGHALDKVLLVDYGSRYVFYARRLFRDRARFAMAVHADGRIEIPDKRIPAKHATREIVVTSRFGIRVRGDYVQFADRQGTDLARVALPWLPPEDRDEIARRIGVFVDRDVPP